MSKSMEVYPTGQYTDLGGNIRFIGIVERKPPYLDQLNKFILTPLGVLHILINWLYEPPNSPLHHQWRITVEYEIPNHTDFSDLTLVDKDIWEIQGFEVPYD